MHYFLLCLLGFVFGLSFAQLRKLYALTMEFYVKNKESMYLLNERLTDLRDHIKRTESYLFKALDGESLHSFHLKIEQQISALQEEIRAIPKTQVKPKKAKPKKAKA